MKLLSFLASVGTDTANKSDRHHVRAVCSSCLSVSASTPQAIETPQEVVLGKENVPATYRHGLQG